MAKLVKVQVLTGVVGEDGKEWVAHSVHSCSADFGRYLVHTGRAAFVQLPDPPGPLTTKSVESADPVAQHRDPPPARGKK